MKQTLILAVLDGWGLGAENEGNPIYGAKPETINYIEKNFPVGALQASGLAVGLPWEEEGNSEVGHLTLGAGRVLYQHFLRISEEIKNGSFFENIALKKVFAHARENKSAVHLIGLLTEGSVHAALPHLQALIQMAEKENCDKVYLQLFTDGRDSNPHSAKFLIQKLNGGTLASLSGRFYAMNRDGHWDRTEKTYQVLTGTADLKPKTPEEAIKETYEKNLNDEYIEPAIINEAHPIQDNDSLIFFNFREDRMTQITEPFLNLNFNKFPTKKIKNIFVATMTPYAENSKAEAAYIPEIPKNTLGEILSKNDKIQLRIAETEKYAHVTYFFNGLKKEPFPNEYRILIPSERIAHYDEHPEMRAKEITDRALISLNEGGFDFILANYANPDMIAHTGNFQATVQTIKIIDRELGRLIKSVLERDHILLITSDHGNAESLIEAKTGEVETKHNVNPVPFYLIGKKFYKNNPEALINKFETIGMLADVAPTILELMELEKPEEMTGQSLLGQLV